MRLWQPLCHWGLHDRSSLGCQGLCSGQQGHVQELLLRGHQIREESRAGAETVIIHQHRAFHISCTSQEEARLEEAQRGLGQSQDPPNTSAIETLQP